MKLIAQNDVVNLAKILRIPDYDLDSIIKHKDAIEGLKDLLRNRQIKTLLIKRTPTKTYHDLNAREKMVADLLFKQSEFSWLKKHFALFSTEVGDDVDKLERLVRDPTLILPEEIRQGVLELVKRHKAK